MISLTVVTVVHYCCGIWLIAFRGWVWAAVIFINDLFVWCVVVADHLVASQESRILVYSNLSFNVCSFISESRKAQ